MLVIDYNTVVLKNAEHLKKFISRVQPVPNSNTLRGLVLTVSKADLKRLDSLEPGLPKIKFLNTIHFTDHAWVFFDKKRKICELFNASPEVIKSIAHEFPDYSYWIGIDRQTDNIDESIECCITHGYGHPYMSKTSPLGFEFKSHGVCMTKLTDPDDPTHVRLETNYVIEQFVVNHEKNCDLKIRLSSEAIRYLHSLPLDGHGSGNQKEISGVLKIKGAKKVGDLFVYTIETNREKGSPRTGKAESVTIDKSLYNFHSHPKEAYESHRVKYAWPSVQDFVGYYDAVKQYKTIFHGVTTLEGLYFISLDKDFDPKRVLSEGEIKSVYMETRGVNTPYEFVDLVNNRIREKFFKVGFLPWERAGDIISISYPKFEDNCFVSDKSLESYEKLMR